MFLERALLLILNVNQTKLFAIDNQCQLTSTSIFLRHFINWKWRFWLPSFRSGNSAVVGLCGSWFYGRRFFRPIQWNSWHQNDAIGIVLLFLLLLWTYFTSCSSVSIVKFEHVSAGWNPWTKHRKRSKKKRVLKIFLMNAVSENFLKDLCVSSWCNREENNWDQVNMFPSRQLIIQN